MLEQDTFEKPRRDMGLLRFVFYVSCDLTITSLSQSISRCSSIVDLNIATSFVDISAVRAETLVLKVQICLHIQARASANTSKFISKIEEK